MMSCADIAQARDAILAARDVVFLTGAGISAASGVPVFRGSGIVWRADKRPNLRMPTRSLPIRCLFGHGIFIAERWWQKPSQTRPMKPLLIGSLKKER